MPNIATYLKSEISRIARKEIRSELLGLQKSVSTYRSEIAALKRRALSLELAVRRIQKPRRAAGAPTDQSDSDASGKAVRFSAKALASQRRRLELSANECGLLIGASGQSIYKWESSKARPRAKHLAAIAALKTLSKKDVPQILAARA